MHTESHDRHYTVREASAYMREKYGYPAAVNTLNKFRVYGGGPKFRKSGKLVLYPENELNTWVREKLGAVISSTSAGQVEEAA